MSGDMSAILSANVNKQFQHFTTLLTLSSDYYVEETFLLLLLPRREKTFILYKQDYSFCQGQKLRDFCDAKLDVSKENLVSKPSSFCMLLSLLFNFDKFKLKF